MKRVFLFILALLVFACTEEYPAVDIMPGPGQENVDPDKDPDVDPDKDDDKDTDKDEPTAPSLNFVSFRYKVGAMYKSARVDTVARVITIPNLAYSGQISDVMFALNDTTITVTPDPRSLIGDWAEEETLTLTKGADTVVYTVKIPNFIFRPNFPSLHFVEFDCNVDDEVFSGKIDTLDHKVVIKGVKYSDQIKSVDFELNDPAIVVTPAPSSLIGNDWEKVENFTLVKGDDTIRYEVELADFVAVLKPAPKMVIVNPSVKKQLIDVVGGDMERSQGAIIAKSTNPEEIMQWCFGDIPFNVCRVSYDKKQEMVEGTKNFAFYTNAIKSMKMVKAINPDIKFWTTMKSDYNGYGGENNLPEWICDDRPTTRFDCDKYAIFLADYLELMQNNGVGIEYMSTAKEWVQAVSAVRAKAVILKLNEECKARGVVQPKYVDAATWSMAQGVSYVTQAYNAGSMDLYYAFSTHNYNSGGTFKYENFVAATAKYNKKAYADETGYGAGGPTKGAEPDSLDIILGTYREKCELYSDGMHGEIVFEVFSRGLNNETRAVYFKSGGAGRRMRSYYIMKEFINGLSGDKHYTTHKYDGFVASDNVYTMSFVGDDELFVCLVNFSKEAHDAVRIQVDGSAVCEADAKFATFDIDMPITGTSSTIGARYNSYEFAVTPKSLSFITIPLK